MNDDAPPFDDDDIPAFDAEDSAPPFDAPVTNCSDCGTPSDDPSGLCLDCQAKLKAAPSFDCPRCEKPNDDPALPICKACQSSFAPEDEWVEGSAQKASHRAIIMGYVRDEARRLIEQGPWQRSKLIFELARFAERLVYRPLALFGAAELDRMVAECADEELKAAGLTADAARE